jgi:hypothetical protein
MGTRGPLVGFGLAIEIEPMLSAERIIAHPAHLVLA